MSDDAPAPTPPSERVVGLDAVRGVAILGILLVNVHAFGLPGWAIGNPTVYGDLTGANYLAWLFTHVFAHQKFLTVFTVLFGASVLLFVEGRASSEERAVALHYRRTFWLLAIGLAHAYLLWDGDILVPYALCGFVLVAARRWGPTALAVGGTGMLAVPSAQEVYYGVTADSPTFDAWDPGEAALQAELAAYRSGWLEQLPYRANEAFEAQTAGFLAWSFWRLGGLMLLGMALYRWGVLTNDRPRRFYRRLAAVGGAAGLALAAAGVVYATHHDWAVEVALFYRQFNYWGSVLLGVAYVALVMLYCDARTDGVLTRSLAAVGRTAFSNYLLQTVVATSIFYGHGLGLFGHLSRVELLGVVLLVWAIQVPLSVAWLRRYRFGPVEWLWRTLTYGERQPMREPR